jgi:hypothetical protein
MKKKAISFFLFVFVMSTAAYSIELKILIEIPNEKAGETTLIAINRIRESVNSNIDVDVVYTSATNELRNKYGLSIILGDSKDSPELQHHWKNHSSAKEDSYLIYSISKNPLVVIASGVDIRGTLYAAYHLADLLKTDVDISNLKLFFQPKVSKRYASVSAITHGGRYYRPGLFYKSLKELPRYGYNGVFITPGSKSPIGRDGSPVSETKEGKIYSNIDNTKKWKNFFNEIKKYQLDIMIGIPSLIPPGYSDKEIDNFYMGGDEPKEYISNLKSHFRQFLDLLSREYPEIDMYLFSSTEGLQYGRTKRFFASDNPKDEHSTNTAYLINCEKVMMAYFDVIKDFFQSDLNRVGFWTHSWGITNQGILKMREILFQYPEVLIIEDDYWNNNLWVFQLPIMNYLPGDLRAKIHTQNPFGMFFPTTSAEYYGGGSLPNSYPGPHIKSAKEALKRNARMVIHAINTHDRTIYGTLFGTVEIIPLCASKQLWDPTPGESQIWQEWANRRFGTQAAPFVINALQESKNIILDGLTLNGVDLLGYTEIRAISWIKDDSRFTQFDLFCKPNTPMILKSKDSIIYSSEYTIYQMNTHSIPINTYRKNQNKALQSIRYALKEIEKAKPYLEKQDYQMLNKIFSDGQKVIKALKLLGEAAYATNIIISNYDNIEDPFALFNKSINNLEEYINDDNLIPQMDENLVIILNNYKQVGKNIFNK